MQNTIHFFRNSAVLLLLWWAQTEAGAPCELPDERRYEVAGRYAIYKCAKRGDFLNCVAEKGFRCEPATFATLESYWCVMLTVNGQVEGLVIHLREGWTGSVNWNRSSATSDDIK